DRSVGRGRAGVGATDRRIGGGCGIGGCIDALGAGAGSLTPDRGVNERPARQWEGWSAAELAARWGAGQVRLFARVGSTNAVGRRLGLTEGAAPLVIVADEQVAGRGRAGRGWHSPAGLGLWVSAVVPPVDAQLMPSLPLRVGLAVAAALDDFLPSPGAAVKWPNDLWIAD